MSFSNVQDVTQTIVHLALTSPFLLIKHGRTDNPLGNSNRMLPVLQCWLVSGPEIVQKYSVDSQDQLTPFKFTPPPNDVVIS